MDDTKAKRKAEPDARDERHSKKAKGKKNWEMPRKKDKLRTIQPGDSGIWATCAMNKEAKSVGDLRDLFQEYAIKLYGATNGSTEDGSGSDSDGGDIEAEINKEIANIRKPSTKPLFASIKLDTQCLVFFRTRQPVEPVSFVHRICQDIADGAQFGNLRYVKRLTPMTAYEKATLQGLDTVAKRVLAPHFHDPDQTGKKFAIRPSIRNNKEFKRDQIIKSVAAAVGPGHKVDLRGYDLLILVEIYQNVIGMSVVGPDFENLKRFNLEELRQPVPATEPKPKETVIIKEDK